MAAACYISLLLRLNLPVPVIPVQKPFLTVQLDIHLQDVSTGLVHFCCYVVVVVVEKFKV